MVDLKDFSDKDFSVMRYIIAAFLSLMLVFKADAAAHPAATPHTPKMDVVIYTIPGCPGCCMAKSMLEGREIPYKEIDLTGKPSVYQEMIRKTGGHRTVPQIFINGRYIGGYSNLSSSDLDALVDNKSQQRSQ
jgi:glutaredoxin 3